MSKPVGYSLDKTLEIYHLRSSSFSKFVGSKAATLLKSIPPQIFFKNLAKMFSFSL